MRFLRIHPVQSVVNNITQLYGRGFPHIFHMDFVCRNFMFFGTSKWKSGRAIWAFANLNFEILKFWILGILKCWFLRLWILKLCFIFHFCVLSFFFEIFNASIAGIHHFHSFKLSNAAIPASAPGRVLYIYIYIFMYMEHRSNLATRNVTFVVFCICVNMWCTSNLLFTHF